MKKFMKNVKNNRVFDYNEALFNRNKKTFAMCDSEGNVEGEKLAKTNEVLEQALETTELEVIELKKDIIQLKQELQDQTNIVETVSIELAGTQSKYADFVTENSKLKKEIKELKGIISNKTTKSKNKK